MMSGLIYQLGYCSPIMGESGQNDLGVVDPDQFLSNIGVRLSLLTYRNYLFEPTLPVGFFCLELH